MMKQTPRLLTDRIDHATWDQHRETIHRLFIRENRKLEGPEGVMQVMSKVHGFSATKPQYEARFRSWNIRKKITERKWVAIVLHVYARAQQGRKTQVMFNGALLDEERVAREINRRLPRYNLHLNNSQDLPRIPVGFRLQSPPSSPIPYADNAISDTTWRHRIAPERYGKQKRSMPDKHSDESLDFFPGCMTEYSYKNLADKLSYRRFGNSSFKWKISPSSEKITWCKDKYNNGYLWEWEGQLNLCHESWHCNDCSNRQPPSPVHEQCEQCGSTDGTLLEQKFQ